MPQSHSSLMLGHTLAQVAGLAVIVGVLVLVVLVEAAVHRRREVRARVRCGAHGPHLSHHWKQGGTRRWCRGVSTSEYRRVAGEVQHRARR